MLRDEGAHPGRHSMALRQLQAGVDVIGDHLRAGGGRELVVRVLALHLVFNVVPRLGHLADVMEVAADPHQKRVCAHPVGRPLPQVADDDAVVKGARRLLLKPPQQRMVELGQLHELHTSGDAEHQAEDHGSTDDDHGG